MKHFLLFLIPLSVLSSLSSYSQCGDSTMIVLSKSQEESDPMEYTGKTVKRFNDLEKLILETRYDRIGDNWQPYSKDSLFYFYDTLIAGKEVFLWDNNQWNPSSLQTYQYLNDTAITLDLFQVWQNNYWRDSLRTVYTYNAAWQVTNIVNQYSSGGPWITNGTKIYVYDSAGNLIRFTQPNVQQTLIFNDGINDTLIIYQDGLPNDTNWYNVLDQVVMNIPVKSEMTLINRSGMAPGIYFFTVYETEEIIFQGKLIVE